MFLDSEREDRSWGFHGASRSIIHQSCSAVKVVLRGQGFGSVVEREEFPEDFDKYLRTELNWSRLEDAVDETHIAGWVFSCRGDDRPPHAPQSLHKLTSDENMDRSWMKTGVTAFGRIIVEQLVFVCTSWIGLSCNSRSPLVDPAVAGVVSMASSSFRELEAPLDVFTRSGRRQDNDEVVSGGWRLSGSRLQIG
ncbi:hypothetical protein RHMOL_Rhmol12G0222200 [Rhododendron molle]|uniref:Uncharacterized protein n=1 Tax=Rhododendron molle TaxID=49168 RepID=A0ACC0LLY0_RHOML|nr:hypothetical protein RHMOL_Rhmol12G0222200 [Rhododendron molle]